MRKPQDVNLFPFTITNASYGLDALWIKHKPKEASWSTVECVVQSPTNVVFNTFQGWNAQREFHESFSIVIPSTDLEHYVEQRKKAIVNTVFAYEEWLREEARIAKRKAEIHAELFNKE